MFINSFKDNSIIENIRNTILDFYTSNEHAIKFSENIKLFLTKNKIDECLITEEVVFEYWINLYNLYYHNNEKYIKWSHEVIHNYVIAITRLQEFLIYIYTSNNDTLKDIFLSKNKKIDDCYYFHIKNNINQNLKTKYFHIKKIDKINCIIIDYNEQDDYRNPKHYYISSIKTQPFKKDNIILLDHFFKLDDHYVEEIFELVSSNNIIEGRNNRGLFGKRIPFEVYDNVKLNTITFSNENKDISIESLKENRLKSNKIQSPIFCENVPDLVNDEFNNLALKYDTSSKYKRFKIAKAISNTITKRNLSLQSNYNLPEFESFKKFFLEIKNKNSISSNNKLYMSIIELSLFTAIEIKKLLLVLLELDNSIKYKSNNFILKIQINKNIFASAILDEDFSEDTKNQTCEIYLYKPLAILWKDTSDSLMRKFYETYTNKNWLENLKNLKKVVDIEFFYQFLPKYETEKAKLEFSEFIKYFKSEHTNEKIKEIEKLEIVDTFLEEFSKEIDNYFKLEIKKYHKKIILSINSIHKLFLHYFKKNYHYSELNLLFTQSISKNDEARLCYNTTKDRLTFFEDKSKEFYNNIYKNESSDLEEARLNKLWIGSPFYIKKGAFKNFILELTKIKSDLKNQIVNLNMIFIRYGLSILLGTRDFHNSANLSEYSKELRILLIQEKAKNLYSGKRIIPLCNLAIKLIDTFYLIKNKYKINSNSPILLNKENIEEPITKKNILKFLDTLDQDKYKSSIDFIRKFINNTKLNLGRHILTSYLSASSVPSNYIDALLNHFQMGKEDQGIYSNFDNQDYMKTIENKLDKLSFEYFPNNIKICNYEYRK